MPKLIILVASDDDAKVAVDKGKILNDREYAFTLEALGRVAAAHAHIYGPVEDQPAQRDERGNVIVPATTRPRTPKEGLQALCDGFVNGVRDNTARAEREIAAAEAARQAAEASASLTVDLVPKPAA